VLAVFDQVDQASEAVSAIIARGLVPAAMEMIDQLTIEAVEDAFGCGYPRDAAAALLIELDGLAAGMEAQAERVLQACRDCGARDVRAARDEAERQLLWKGRKSAFGAFGRISPAYMVMDGVIPRTKLPYVLGRVNAIVAAHGLRVGNVFHAGDGNLHPNILYDPRKPGEEARVVAAGAEILKVCAEVGGSISGEHGIGLEKADYMPFIFSEADLACMHQVKDAFNPTGLCNPGKIFPSNKACVEVGPAYRPHPIEEKASLSASSAGIRSSPCRQPCWTSYAASSAPRMCSRAWTARPTWWRAAHRRRRSSRHQGRDRGSAGGGRRGGPAGDAVGRRHQDGDRLAAQPHRPGAGAQAARPHPRARAGRSHGHRRGGLPFETLQAELASAAVALARRGRLRAGHRGGMLASDASGPRRHLYGTARDLVIGLTVVMADGSLVRAVARWSRTWPATISRSSISAPSARSACWWRRR